MIDITNFIIEKLKINSKSKVNNISNLRDLSNVSILHSLFEDLYFKTPSEEHSNLKKMDEYKAKGSNPVRLLNSIKDHKKLIVRWFIAIQMDWPECARVFRQGIIDRGYYTEDELDAYILKRYNIYKNRQSNNNRALAEKYLKYLNEFNVKTED